MQHLSPEIQDFVEPNICKMCTLLSVHYRTAYSVYARHNEPAYRKPARPYLRHHHEPSMDANDNKKAQNTSDRPV